MGRYFHFFWPFHGTMTNISASMLYRELQGITLCGMLWPVLTGIVLYYFGLSLTPDQQLLGMTVIVPGGVLAVIVVWYVTLRRDIQPMMHFLQTPEGELNDTIVSNALVQAYNFQLLSAKRVLFYQTPVFAIFFTLLALISNLFLAHNLEVWQALIAIMVSLMVGIGHAVFEYYAVVVPIRAVITSARRYYKYLPDEVCRRITPVNMKSKLLLVSALVMVPTAVILGVTLLIKVRHELTISGLQDQLTFMPDLMIWMVLVIIVGYVKAVSIFIRMAADVSDSTVELSQAMKQVELGKLDVQLVENTSDEFLSMYRSFNHMVSELQERERLRDAFGRYVARELADDVMKNGVLLGCREVSATVLFADIRDFTAMSETMAPQNVVNLLNQYFSAMEPMIKEEGGWINKFGGDSLLAVFGVLPPDNQHTQHAIVAALKMRKALARFNKERKQQGAYALRIGMGIHTGLMVAGSVGSENRMEYTVIGDAVNVASRIEGLTKKWGNDILISEEVAEALHNRFILKAMPKTEVRGISHPIQVYAVTEKEFDV